MGAIEAAAGMADAEIVDSPPLVARHQSESGAKPATSHTPTSSRAYGKKSLLTFHLLAWTLGLYK